MIGGKAMLREDQIDDNQTQQSILEERRAFMKLPLEERRKILAQEAEEAAEHYQEDYKEWNDLQGGDIVEY
jgi:hypothetical protein